MRKQRRLLNLIGVILALIILGGIYRGCSKKSEFKKWKVKGLKTDDPQEQVECFTRALEFWKKTDSEKAKAVVYTKRGNAYAEIGHYSVAIGDYDKAVSVDPECAEAYSKRANLLDTKDNIFAP